jgi:hypothetical protein
LSFGKLTSAKGIKNEFITEEMFKDGTSGEEEFSLE